MFDNEKLRDGVQLNEAEARVLKMMILKLMGEQEVLELQTLLCCEGETEEWLNDVVTEMAAKVMTMEESWQGRE